MVAGKAEDEGAQLAQAAEGDGERPRDPTHWLHKMTARQWLDAARAELRRAETLYREHNGRGGLASARRAAGMALNAALIVEPRDWGRSFVDHLVALAVETAAPEAVRGACRVLLDTQPPGPDVIALRSAKGDARVVEAARDVVAHAYAVVVRTGPVAGEAP